MPEKKVLIPEIIEPDEALPPDLVALRKFALLMDEAFPIPGTKRRIGLDAAVGFIPGVGDAIGGVLSAWIIIGGLRHRVPLRKILRMIVNVVADVVFGSVPIIGDIVDFFFEENVMNLQLLLKHRNRALPPRTFGQVALAAAGVIAIILAFALLPIGALVIAALWVIGQRGF